MLQRSGKTRQVNFYSTDDGFLAGYAAQLVSNLVVWLYQLVIPGTTLVCQPFWEE
ncbi:MAG: hypothetical protein U0401_26935 [Anaerolineae bacterium]